MQFLLANAFKTPLFMIRPEILRRIQTTGIVERVRTSQASILGGLLQAARLDRMVEQTALDGNVAYPPVHVPRGSAQGRVGRAGYAGAPRSTSTGATCSGRISTIIDDRLNNGPEPSDEVRSLLKGELRALDKQLQTALPSVTDEVTHRHLQDSRDEIATILDPRAMRTRPAAAAAGAGGRGRGGVRW